jgi:hypothetical protein
MRAPFLLLLFPALAHAAPNDELAYGGWIRTLHAPSANAVTEDSLTGPKLEYARELLHDVVVPKLSLWLTGSFDGGDVDGTMFQVMTTKVEYFQFAAGARARYEVWPFLIAGARIEAGTARTSLAIDNAGVSYTDHGWGAVTAGALSLDLLPYAGRKFACGVRSELGFTTASAIDLTPRAQTPDDGTIELPMTRSSLGHLDLGGTTLAFTVFASF